MWGIVNELLVQPPSDVYVHISRRTKGGDVETLETVEGQTAIVLGQ